MPLLSFELQLYGLQMVYAMVAGSHLMPWLPQAEIEANNAWYKVAVVFTCHVITV